MDETIKPHYRRLRSGFGWAIAGLWIVLRWLWLSHERSAAIAALKECSGILASAGCNTSAALSHAGFFFGMVATFALAPFAFLIAHFIARAIAEHQATELRRTQDDAMVARLTQDDAQQRARTDQANQHAQRARLATSRAEFLNSLGSVNDYLDLLGAIQGAEQELRVKQGIGKELRDLVAKYPLADLEQLIGDDEAIQISLTSTLGRLERLDVAADAAAVLRHATARAPSSRIAVQRASELYPATRSGQSIERAGSSA